MEKLPEQQKDNEVESPEKKKERIVPIDWWFKYGKTVNSESHNVGWEYDIIKKTPSVNENTALALAGEAKEILCKAFYSPSSLEYPVAGFINMMGNNMFAAKMYRSKYSTPSGHYWIQRNVAFISTEKFDELGGHVEALLQTKSFGDNKEVRIQEKYDPLDSLEVPVKEDKEYIADYLSFDENASVVLANFMRGLLGPKKMIVYVNYENARDYYLALYGAAISCLPLRARKDALFVLDAYDMFASEVKMVKINFCGSYYAERQGYYQEYKSKFSNFDVMSGTKAKLALQESKYVEKIMRGIEMMKKDPDAGYRVIQDIVNDPRLSEVKLDTLDKISSNYYKNEMERLSEKKEEKISEIEKEEIDRLIGERMNLFRENTQLFLNSGYLKKKDETARLEGVRKGLDALEKIIGEEIAMRINENGNYKSAADVEKDMKEIIGSVALNHKEYSKQKFPQSDTFARIVNEINAPLNGSNDEKEEEHGVVAETEQEKTEESNGNEGKGEEELSGVQTAEEKEENAVPVSENKKPTREEFIAKYRDVFQRDLFDGDGNWMNVRGYNYDSGEIEVAFSGTKNKSGGRIERMPVNSLDELIKKYTVKGEFKLKSGRKKEKAEFSRNAEKETEFSPEELKIIEIYGQDAKEMLNFIENLNYEELGYEAQDIEQIKEMEKRRFWNKFKEDILNEGRISEEKIEEAIKLMQNI